MAELFGFRIEKSNKVAGGGQSFTSPTSDDGTIEVAGGGFFGQVLDTDGRQKSDYDLIRRYRDIAQQAECDTAVEDIVNEGIVSNQNDQAVEISLDRLPYTDKIKRKIRKEFSEVLRLLHFDQKGHDIFRRWYVDGRIYYHKIIDPKNTRKGITELRWIDASKIKKVREVKKKVDAKTGVAVVDKFEEYFLYNEGSVYGGGHSTATGQGLKIAADSITYVPSGLIDGNSGRVLSYLHKAIKPVNQLRMIEDALVIYRISRAPERRIFYIDVGNLPKIKAEQYLKDVMNRYRNKLVYDANTGEIRDDRNHMSMLEDFWLPRREGGRGTEITTLPGGSNLGEIDDITYFQRKLYRSLNVPISRMESESGFSLGRAAEITRDELKFTKFVQRIRKKFVPLFTDVLKTQLLLKGIVAPDDWIEMQEHIQYDFLQDGHFAELKDAELLENRLNQLQTVESYIGTFFSKEYVLKKVLRMNDTEIQEMRDQIKKEMDTDPMDGGIVVPAGGDGIHRIPVGPDGMPLDPEMPSDDRAKMALGIPPEEEGGEAPPEEEPVEDDLEIDKGFLVKNGLKGRKK
ncbi:MAG: portal protein [Candidatus Pacebacteria bacterium]|nr:portal protein [Candidatus Paceibacterota bacterium]